MESFTQVFVSVFILRQFCRINLGHPVNKISKFQFFFGIKIKFSWSLDKMCQRLEF